MKNRCLAFMVLFGLATANADNITLYHDDFSGSSANVLDGTTPDITTGASTWIGNPIIKANGSFSNLNENFSAYVPLTIVAGHKYTLSMDVVISTATASTRNICLGFAPAAATTTISWSANTRNVAAIALTFAGSINTYADGIGSGLSTYMGGSTYTNAALKIVLSTYTNATPWTAEYFYDGNSMGSVVVANGSDIDKVGFSGGLDSGIVDNFHLTDTPPPSRTLKIYILRK